MVAVKCISAFLRRHDFVIDRGSLDSFDQKTLEFIQELISIDATQKLYVTVDGETTNCWAIVDDVNYATEMLYAEKALQFNRAEEGRDFGCVTLEQDEIDDSCLPSDTCVLCRRGLQA